MANLLKQLFSRQPQANQQDPVQQQANPMQQAAITGMTPPNGATAAAPTQSEQSVLDQLQHFMQNKDQGQQQAQAPRFNIPQEELGKIVSGQDFTKGIPPEVMQGLQSGDPTAIVQALNHVGRASYQASLTHSMGLTDSFVQSRFDHEQSSIQGLVDQRLTNRNLDASIKHMHPYAQNMFKQMAADFRKQFPDASEEDIQDTAWAAMKEIGAQTGNDPASVAQRQKTEQAQPDWDKFGDFDASADQAAAVPQGGQGLQ